MMNPYPRLFCIVGCIFLFAASPFFAAGAGSEAIVPDLETSINNTGSVVPPSAIPPLVAPLPAVLPPVVAPSADASPVLPATQADPTPAPADPAEPADQVPFFNGSARLSAGSPGLASGSLSLARSGGTLPSFALDFDYDSSDGYGREGFGSGWFDRTVKLGASVSSGNRQAKVAVSDRANGFQKENPRYLDLVRRDVDWSFGASSALPDSSPFALSVEGEGLVFTTFAEGSGTDSSSPSLSIADATGYFLSPLVALSFSKENFKGELSGRYGYESVADSGELNSGEGTLALSWALSDVTLSASGGIAGDGTDHPVAPFSLGVSWNSLTRFIREAHVSGGLQRIRYSPYALADVEPFSDPSGMSVYGADWTVSSGFSVSPPVSPSSGSSLSLGVDADYRRSLAGHGLLVVTDELLPSGLVAVSREERESLATSASARWLAGGMEISGLWNSEWMDRLYRRSLQSASLESRFFNRGSDRVWEADAGVTVALDRADMPELSAKALYSPVRNLELSVSLEDAIPLLLGKERTRNGLYAERSGSVALCAEYFF